MKIGLTIMIRRDPTCLETRCAVKEFSIVLLLIVFGLGARASASGDRDFFRPDISPDGKTIAFEFHSDIWTAPIGGGEGQRLTQGPDRYGVPAWSPDGRLLACVATDPEVRQYSLRLIDRATGAQQILWSGDQPVSGTMDWSPDGKSLVASVGIEPMLTRFLLSGDSPQPLDLEGMHPRYSPGGRYLGYQTGDNEDLWIVELTTGEKHRLATNIGVKSSFDWSPDGNEIVYESVDRESLDLWKVAAGGGRALPLTSDIALEQGPRWHPDNGHIYFSHRRRIWRIRSDGSGLSRVPIQCSREVPAPAPALALTGVHLINVDDGRLERDRTLIVRQGRIEAVQPAGVPLPSDVQRIEGHGRVAMPGLMDMHVHYEPWMGPFFLRYGVTRVLDLGSGSGLDRILALGEEIAGGRSRGPLLFQSGSVFNGSGVTGPPGMGGFRSDDPGAIRRTLLWHIEEGIEIVKIGSENNRSSLRTIIETAHAHDLRVVGHIALVPVQEAIAMGQDGIEHPRGIGWGTLPPGQVARPVPRGLSGMLRESTAWLGQDEQMVARLIRQMVDARVIWNPTLKIWDLLGDPRGEARDPEFGELPQWVQQKLKQGRATGFYGTWDENDYRDFAAPLTRMRSMVGRFHQQGGTVTAGSDGGIPGLSLLQELDQLSQAGLSPLDCLRAATRNAASSLRRSADLGSLHPGKVADIVLLSQNPLEDLSRLREVDLVIQNGRIVYSKEARK